ncbi:MAG: hypothetical protein FNT15_05040 [Sulfurovum sp.]|jgi:hypothetical protein|nr:MAG: hypothetical protein FNT15_05040 [Sulfurovum sp.]
MKILYYILLSSATLYFLIIGCAVSAQISGSFEIPFVGFIFILLIVDIGLIFLLIKQDNIFFKSIYYAVIVHIGFVIVWLLFMLETLIKDNL